MPHNGWRSPEKEGVAKFSKGLLRQGWAVPHNERRSLEGRRSQNSGGFTGKAERCLTTGGV